MSAVSTYCVTDSVAVLTFDNPPVNALSREVRAALAAGVARAGSDPAVRAVVIACAGRTFFAGADIREFGKPPQPPSLVEVVDAIGASAKPVVAAIHGTALGGGLEVAMGCHYRVALSSAKLGLPEVKLGLLPGARGTVMLPRLVGVEQALGIMALGEPIGASEAQAIGLVDKVVEGDLAAAATAFAADVADRPIPRARDKAAAPVADAVYEDFTRKHARKLGGLDAPPAILRAVRNATTLPYEEAARRERDEFIALRDGAQSKALRYAFFAEREAAKVPGLEGVAQRPVESVGIVGAGTMGSGIAIAMLAAGLAVKLFEQDAAALDRGVATIRSTIEANVRSGRTDAAKGEAALAALTPTLAMDDLGQADLVIEAVYELMEVKQAVFRQLDAIARPGAILASNTSYLDIDAMAAVTKRPGDVLGLHFFSPANIMKLLEIVRGRETAPDVLATALALARRIGKQPVVAGNAHGFIGNRMLAARRPQTEAMILSGAAPHEVDRVLESFGFPMGPFRMSDLAGLDLGWSAETSSGATVRERLCEAGRRGQKSGSGFYDYDDARKPTPSAAAEAIIAGLARDQGIVRREFSDAEILDRLIWPMVDEGAKILAEDIAQRESDIDVVWLHGYGWPRWTGGPMHYAREVGIAEVCKRLGVIGHRPSEALRALA